MKFKFYIYTLICLDILLLVILLNSISEDSKNNGSLQILKVLGFGDFNITFKFFPDRCCNENPTQNYFYTKSQKDCFYQNIFYAQGSRDEFLKACSDILASHGLSCSRA